MRDRRGYRNWFHATGLPGWLRGEGQPAPAGSATEEHDVELLRQQAEYLQEALDDLNRRIEELEGKSEGD